MSATSQMSIQLVLLTSLDTESQFKVRDIRNEESIRKWMYTDHIIGVNEHLGWISHIKQDRSQIVFAVLNEKHTPIGVVSVSSIDLVNKKADWAYYLSEAARGGLGSALEYSFINFVFGLLGMEKLNCEVVEGNDAVVALHKRFFFQEEGFRRANVVKAGKRIGSHLLGLTKDDWLSGAVAIQEKYKGVFEKFSITIQWQPSGQDAMRPIDRIEAERARNNLNWMSILRLALEKSPEIAKPIVTEIRRIDGEISSLTDMLIKRDD